MSTLVPKVTRGLTRMPRTFRKTFNLDKLRLGQAVVIRSVLEGNNTLAIMARCPIRIAPLPPSNRIDVALVEDKSRCLI